MPESDQLSSTSMNNEQETANLNDAFVHSGSSSGSDTDISGFPSSESSIPSSLCSDELNKTMNEILSYLESQVKVLKGHEIPKRNENQYLAPLDHFRKFLPVYLTLEPPIVHQAQEIAADGSEQFVDIIVPRKKVSRLYFKILY